MKERPVFVIAGPTASGKTEISIRLAEQFDGEIISCDSMAIYRYMDIGSAKPTKEERERAVHHLVDFVDPGEDFSAAAYQKLAKEAIRDIQKRGRTAFVTGGTGLYLNALLYDMDFGPSVRNDEYREKLWKIAETEGEEALHRRLKEVDEESAARIHPNNVKRVIRALEAAELEERPLADFGEIARKNTEFSFALLGITWDREELYDRINRRVLTLMDRGLLEEVKSLKEMGFTDEFVSMKGIGYKELLWYLDGQMGREESVETIQKNTRHYAKRQLTWFRRYEDMTWFNGSQYDSMDEMYEDIAQWVSKKL